MSYSYTPGTAVWYVRILIPDTDPAAPIFSDEEIAGFMAINEMTWQSSMYYSYQAGAAQLPCSPGNYLRAAALALNALAGNQSRLMAVSKLLDVQLQAVAAVAKALQDTAQRYLDMDNESGAIAIAEQVTTVWGFRDRWLAQVARQTGGGNG